MVRVAVVVSALSLVALARDPGCGGVDASPRGVNAPCTRAKDCHDGLACERGVCIDPDASVVDASLVDAGADATPEDAATHDG